MPHYQRRGEIPKKRHTQFRKQEGGLYSEQLFSTEGFSNDYSLLYHCQPPTAVTQVEGPVDTKPIIGEGENLLKSRSLDGFAIKPAKDYLESRVTVLVNDDVHIVLA